MDLLLDAIINIPQIEQPLLKSKIVCLTDYKISVSEGAGPFTMENVYALEDENDMRGQS